MKHNRVIRRVCRYGVLPLSALSIVVCGMTSVSAATGRNPHHDAGAAHQPSMTSLGQAPRGLQRAVQGTMGNDGASPDLTINEHQKLLGNWADNFGNSVSVSNGLAIVGAPTADGPNGESSEGAAYIYVRSSNGVWTQQAILYPSGGAAGDQFGTSVGISGSYAVVGSRDAHNFYGDAYVFVQASNGTWSEQQELSPSQNNQFSSYGVAVAISWPYVVVGAPGQGCAGYAYVFKSVNSAWIQVKQLTPTANGCPGRGFGMSVAAYGNYVVVGSPGESSWTGAAYVFISQSDTWPQQLPTLGQPNPVAGDEFGWSVATDGTSVLVGAPGHQSASGEAFLFAHNSNWYLQRIMSSNGAANDNFGSSVALSSGYAVVGAFGENSLNGAAYAYRGTSGWPLYAQLKASDSVSGTQVGYSVGASMELGPQHEVSIFAGAPGGENDAGIPATYVFSAPQITKKAPCYTNFDPAYDTGVAIASENDSEDSGINSRAIANFTVTKKCIVNMVSTVGQYYDGAGPADSVDVTFYKNQGGRPTKIVNEQDNLSYNDTTGLGSLTAFLDPVTLKKGSYFVSFVANMTLSQGGQWGWELTSNQVGPMDQWENQGGEFGVCPTWGDVLTCTGYGNDFMVTLSN